MIMECKQFICVDADISDICFYIPKFLKKNYEFPENKHIYNKQTPAIEITDEEEFINKLKNEDKFIVCCDSKIEAKVLYNKLLQSNSH